VQRPPPPPPLFRVPCKKELFPEAAPALKAKLKPGRSRQKASGTCRESPQNALRTVKVRPHHPMPSDTEVHVSAGYFHLASRLRRLPQ